MEIFQATHIIGKLPKPLREIVMKSRDVQLMLITRKFELDTIKFDDMLSENDPEYNSKKCTYKEHEQVSCMEYLKLKYGEDIANKVYSLIKSI
jgi:hypothetical protein